MQVIRDPDNTGNWRKKIRFPTSMKELRRIILDHELYKQGVGWPVKWGGQIAIAYTNSKGEKKMANTELTRISDYSVEEWIEFIKNNCI